MRFPPIPSQFEPSLTALGIDVDEQQMTAEIRARPRGVVAWLLRKLGLGMIRVFLVTPQGFRFERTGFWGDYREFYPAAQIATTVYEHRRSVTFLFLAVCLFVAAAESYFRRSQLVESLVLLVLALLSALIYAMKRKQVVLGIVDCSGSSDSLRFNADRFELHNLQRVLQVMEAILDGAPHALPAALDEVPQAARDRLTQLAAAEAVRPAEPGPEFDAAVLSESSAAQSTAAIQTPVAPEIRPPAPPTAASSPEGAGTEAPPQGAIYSCPHCQARMRVPPAMAGRVVRCPSCGGEARVG